MGSRKKIVKGALFNNSYHQRGNPKELYINRLVNAETGGLDIGDDRLDEELLKINVYFNGRNKIIRSQDSKIRIFDPDLCMADSPTHSGAYTILSITNISPPGDNDIVMADYSNTYDSSVTIDNIVVDATTIPNTLDYTLSNGATGSIMRTDAQVTVIEYDNGGTTYYRYVFTEDYKVDTIDKYGFIFDRMKNDGQTKPDREAKHHMYKYGTNQRSFSDAYENDELKDLFYTFCGRADDDEVISFYESLGIEAEVGVDPAYGGEELSPTFSLDLGFGDLVEIYKISNGVWEMRYNGQIVKDEDGNNIVALPIEFFRRKKMVDKYIAVKKYMGMLSLSQKEVKLKWYQTGLFKFIIVIVAFVWGAFTGDFEWFVNMLVSQAVSAVLMSIFKGSIFVNILSVLYSIYNLDFSNITSASSMLAILNIATKIVSTYSQYTVGNLRDEASEISDEEKELRDQLNEYKKQYLYSPLGEYSRIREIPYNAIYNSYDMLNTIHRKGNRYGY